MPCAAIRTTAHNGSVPTVKFKMDGDSLFVERVPRIVDFPKVGLMCFVLLICITERERISRWKRTRPTRA